MNLIRDLYLRFQVLVHEVAKFGVVGAVGFVVQLGVQNVLHSGFGVGALTAVVMAYAVATVVTFVGNRHWAFKHRKGKGLGQEGMLFVLLNVVGIFIQVGVVAFVHYGLHMTALVYSVAVAVLAAVAVGSLLTRQMAPGRLQRGIRHADPPPGPGTAPPCPPIRPRAGEARA